MSTVYISLLYVDKCFRQKKVFNAALVIFGNRFASPKHIGAASQTTEEIGNCSLLLGKAVETLHRLDDGNVTVMRCAHYLQQMLHSLTSRENAIAAYNEELGTSSLLALANLERPAKLGGDPHRVFSNSQDVEGAGNAGNSATRAQIPPVNPFSLENLYGGELELGQFFVGGGMDAWLDTQP